MSDSNSKLWDMPDITEHKEPEDQRKNALNMPLRWAYEPPEADDVEHEEEVIAPLTAAALEAIHEAARLEGFEEGKREGIAAGHQEGFDAGYADGEKLGREAAEKAALAATEELNKSLSDHWQSLFEGLRHPLKQVDQALENQLVHLSMALARAVCWQEVTQNDEVVRAAFKRGIQELGMSAQRVEIFLHPEDLALIEGRWDEKTRADKGWYFYQDETVGRGGCRIETPLVSIDATLEARMNDVFSQLLHDMKEVPPDFKPVISAASEPEPETKPHDSPSDINTNDEAQDDLNPAD